MKKKKLLIGGGLVVLIAIVILVVVFLLFGTHLIRVAVEKSATRSLGVNVTLVSLGLSPFTGNVSMGELVIANPEGYEHENLMTLTNGDVSARIGSLLSDTVRVKQIELTGLELFIEQKGLGTNLQQILDNIKKQQEPSEPKKEGKQVVVEELLLSDIAVNVKPLPVGGKATTIRLELDPIRLTDLGTDKPVDIGQISSQVMVALATGVTRQAGDAVPAQITRGLQSSLEGIGQIGDIAIKGGKDLLDAGGKTLKKGADTGKDIVEGLGGLFKKEEKQSEESE
jgi:uncharacterized protein involved in outer membrane biogenesis